MSYQDTEVIEKKKQANEYIMQVTVKRDTKFRVSGAAVPFRTVRSIICWHAVPLVKLLRLFICIPHADSIHFQTITVPFVSDPARHASA